MQDDTRNITVLGIGASCIRGLTVYCSEGVSKGIILECIPTSWFNELCYGCHVASSITSGIPTFWLVGKSLCRMCFIMVFPSYTLNITPWHGNVLRITGLLWRECTCHTKTLICLHCNDISYFSADSANRSLRIWSESKTSNDSQSVSTFVIHLGDGRTWLCDTGATAQHLCGVARNLLYTCIRHFDRDFDANVPYMYVCVGFQLDQELCIVETSETYLMCHTDLVP